MRKKLAHRTLKDIWNYAHNIIRTSRQMVNEGLRSLQLSSSEGNILQHLFTQDHEVRQEDIVESLDLSNPAMSKALKSLKNKGYVEIIKDPSDRRASRVGAQSAACNLQFSCYLLLELFITWCVAIAAAFSLVIVGYPFLIVLGKTCEGILSIALLVAPLCGIIELFSQRGSDTLTVSLSAAFSIMPLNYFFYWLGW